MSGRLIYLMGPSGSGKDTVLRGLRGMMGDDCHVVRRIVTRPEPGGDDAEEVVSDQQFESMRREGRFAMHWQANGMSYGVPVELSRHLSEGRDVLLNGSRAYFPQARLQYGNVIAVLLRVEAVLLRQRLLHRRRESEEQIAARLRRNGFYASLDAKDGVFVVDNSGDPEQAVTTLYHYLQRTACGK
ncbi:MAG: phosphonate metabolism protein/1,5-bisphosphokinase (PRPP-forming) PhnN [Candidimonas sp.]